MSTVPRADAPQPGFEFLDPDGLPDARCDLTVDPLSSSAFDDRLAWVHLLTAAYTAEGEQGYLLHALRSIRLAGARLEPSASGARIVPGDALRAEWPAIRREWLLPHAETLTRLLAELPVRQQ